MKARGAYEPGVMVVGEVFATNYESGCIVTTTNDEFGEFLALDSDGVECAYSLSMDITRTTFDAIDRVRGVTQAIRDALK